MSEKKETNISFRLDTELYKELKKLASKEGRPLANYLRFVIKDLIRKKAP